MDDGQPAVENTSQPDGLILCPKAQPFVNMPLQYLPSLPMIALCCLCFLFPSLSLEAQTEEPPKEPVKEWFVSVDGSDANDGLTLETAFSTVQKGLDQLQAGGTLTIGPGEYSEAVRRDGLGSDSADTVIRAKIPGTVLLRGDKPVASFRPATIPNVFETDFAGPVEAVSELDTLTLFTAAASADDLQFLRGQFFHDTTLGKLYISTSDLKPADQHLYTASVLNKCGIFLSKPQRVTIEGIATTGFNSATARSLKPETEQGTVWGIWLFQPTKCVVRDCTSYLNCGGIGIQSSATTGGNSVENCTVYADGSPIVASGGILIFGANNDVVRDCLAFNVKPRHYAFRFYAGNGGVGPGPSVMENNIAMSGDISQKGDKLNELASIRDCVTFGELHSYHVANSIGGQNRYASMGAKVSETISLANHKNLDFNEEFADAANGDFRLQSTSRFAQGKDAPAGLSAKAGRTFYLRPDGDDQADGLAVKGAWRTLARAVKELQSGDTLYLSGGRYEGDVSLSLQAKDRIFLRGRGHDTVVLSGSVSIAKSADIQFERLQFLRDVSVDASREITFSDCTFAGERNALSAQKTTDLRVEQSIFSRSKSEALRLVDSSGVFLQGNIFANPSGVAVGLDDPKAILYSDYNGYGDAAKAWSVAGVAVDPLKSAHGEKHSSQIMAQLEEANHGSLALKNAVGFNGRGAFGRSLGPNRLSAPEEVRADNPVVHAVGATTANVEWQTSGPMVCRIGWGTTPECTKVEQVEADQFGTFSLTGLTPGTTYYFRLLSLQPVNFYNSSADDSEEEGDGAAQVAAATSVDSPPISFTTAQSDVAPQTYYVSAEGDNLKSGADLANAWRTVSYAASRVNVGDTVLIASGEYQDRVRIRATGKEGAPITFRALPGAKAFITGGKKQTSPAFLVSGKQHQRIDGLYFKNFNPTGGKWNPLQHSGVFVLANVEDIEITRCFYEGRSPGLSPGYSPLFLWADSAKRLLVKNCVMIRGFHHIGLEDCKDTTITNNVLLQSMIVQMEFRGNFSNSLIANNIITDSLPVKVTASLMGRESAKGLDFQNNDFVLRIPALERNYVFFVKGSPSNPANVEEKQKLIDSTRSLFVDPQFALWKRMAQNQQPPGDKFQIDHLMKLEGIELDFADFISTNEELLKRDVGLQPQAFAPAQ